MEFNVKDGTSKTSETIANYMVYDYMRFCSVHGLIGKSEFYCGITNDMDANYSRHKNAEFKGKEFEYVSIYQCDNAETAAQVENLMRLKHFDCGDTTTFGNGGADDSVFVYMFKKPQTRSEK